MTTVYHPPQRPCKACGQNDRVPSGGCRSCLALKRKYGPGALDNAVESLMAGEQLWEDLPEDIQLALGGSLTP